MDTQSRPIWVLKRNGVPIARFWFRHGAEFSKSAHEKEYPFSAFTIDEELSLPAAPAEIVYPFTEDDIEFLKNFRISVERDTRT